MEDRAKQHFLHKHSHYFVIKTQTEKANINCQYISIVSLEMTKGTLSENIVQMDMDGSLPLHVHSFTLERVCSFHHI